MITNKPIDKNSSKYVAKFRFESTFKFHMKPIVKPLSKLIKRNELILRTKGGQKMHIK